MNESINQSINNQSFQMVWNDSDIVGYGKYKIINRSKWFGTIPIFVQKGLDQIPIVVKYIVRYFVWQYRVGTIL